MSDNQSNAPTNIPVHTLSNVPSNSSVNTPTNTPQSAPPVTSYLSATGKITYTFTNDYMFRAILQRNVTVLNGLICSLLHLRPEHITDITITNPIELGKTIDNKEFSDKLTLGVVDLTHIELATEEDESFQIDRWARLFKATTWEEIKMMAEGNEYLMQATQELYECNADELIRQQCRAREEYYKYQRTINKALKDTTAERDRLASEKAEALEIIQKQQTALKEKTEEILRLQALLAEKE